MTTYDWDPKKIYPQPHLAYEHECVDFEALDNWAQSRSFDITDPKYFVHPTLGECFACIPIGPTGWVAILTAGGNAGRVFPEGSIGK